MVANINEATQKIKRAGTGNVRITPMKGQHPLDGDHQIEIQENNTWAAILIGVRRSVAEDIVRQALNRVICG